MKNKTVIVTLIGLLLLSSIILSGCNEPGATGAIRMDTKADVPGSVWDALAEKSIEPGAYFFNSGFTDSDKDYLIICGSKDYAAGYDVEVTETAFSGGDKEDDGTSHGTYSFKLVESTSSSVPDYSNGSEYPFICFELAKGSAYDTIYKIESGDKELPINYWWGKDEISGMTNIFSYEIIQSRADIPDSIWSKISTFNLQKGVYPFNQEEYESEAYYALVVGGEDYATSYNIAFEEVRYDKEIAKMYDIEAVVIVKMRQYKDHDSLPYAEGFSLPFAVIKLEPKTDKMVRLADGFNQQIQTIDDDMFRGILLMNRDMAK